jgi:ethanolamine-phosphate phospho-lyase
VGHSHPAVVRAGCDELRRIQTNSRFLHPTQQRYLSKLLATLPAELDTVYLVNSGSEANDLALRIARDHNVAKKRNHVVCIDHAYHGHTASLIEVSPYKWHQAIDGVNRQPETTHVVSCPDIYRGKFSAPSMADLTPEVEEGLGRLYAQEVEDIVKETGGVGAFIHESVVCCGGQVIPPKGYFKRCYEAIRSAGGVCIADEVQTGFGRPGTSFWAFQEHGVVPDIVTMGKPMGNGYPIAAVVCKRALANSFAATGIEYFNTYGGNSVACSIAEAVLDTIVSEDLQHNSLVVGSYLVDKLKELSKKYEVIGDVRGMGLFSGVEFIVPPSTTGGEIVPNGDLTKFLVDRLMRERIVVSRDGPDENVIKIKPPLVFDKRNADTLVEGLERALQAAKETQLFF